MSNNVSPEDSLSRLIEELNQEWTHLQTLGRALTAEEQGRSEALSRVLELLRSTLVVLAHGVPAEPPASTPAPLRDGRYRGGNGDLSVDLRVDEGVSGVISADFYKIDASGETWVASIRTNPGIRIALGEVSWDIVGEDQQHATASGHLSLRVHLRDPFTVTGAMRLDKPLAGIPRQTDIAFTAVWQSETLRGLGIELEQERGVADLPTFNFNGKEVTVESALAAAGFETFEVGQVSEVPPPPTPWGTAQLHALMQDHAQASLARSAWELHLLLLSRPSRNGLLGIMFDTTANLPRQGSAVFAEEIRRLANVFERKLIQTTVHELGHGLNLAHRFEREVGRADSTSFMNYDWLYRGGGRQEEFWSRFNFTFDRDELEFLRHAPRLALIPGGRAFHSVSYWSEGNGGYMPYFPEVRITELDLTLRGPTGGLVFDFLQPIFMEVELTNRTGQTLNIPRWWLDPKSGVLSIVVRRITGGSDGEARHWVPVMQRCRDHVPQIADLVPDGGSMRRNLNLTFGVGGFAFAEPGEYEVQAVVSLPNQVQRREFIVPSNSLRIRVAYPKTREEEEDALVLLRNDVGLYFALGGSRALDKARDDLEEVRARRQGKSRKIRDPIVANIVRCAGIDAGRTYLRRRADKFVTDEWNSERAAQLLEQLDDQALRAFDTETAATTKKLAQKHRSVVSKTG